MTLEERIAPIRKAINEVFEADPTLEEGVRLLLQLRQDVNIMLLAIEAKINNAAQNPDGKFIQ